MKLLRYGPRGREKPGLLGNDGQICDLSAVVPDLTPATLDQESIRTLNATDVGALPIVSGNPRIGPCVGQVTKIVCAGLNYFDHATEASLPIPSEPFLFFKPVSAINGPNDDIVIPRGAERCDWETELAMVIGTTARYVSEADALKHVAGYCILNDLADRGFQFGRGDACFARGKSADTFCPIGPYLVTADEIVDPQALDITFTLNGETMQKSSTAQMIFTCAWLISYISSFMSLHPGDIVSTGTPAGTNTGRKPQRFLLPNDEICAGVGMLGEQRARIVAA
jgi:2-keto-4-pentenoate hydratase/2-oxohepta-3-ene-1,7-dioic acid hydratase in catechol pathway